MDLRRLRYFATVAEQLNFRRAAEVLNTSQPSLSQQIRSLERDIGVDLFQRDKRRVRLTAAGIEFLDGVKSVIAEFEATGQRARAAKDGVRGRLRIGVAGMTMIDHVPRIIQRYRTAYPDVDIAVTVARSPELATALQRETLDVAISNLLDAGKGISTEALWEFPSMLVVPSRHPAAGKSAVRLSELNGETLIVHPRRLGGGGANGVVMSLCREQGFVPGAIREVYEIGDLEALVGLVACGLGVTILPSEFFKLGWLGVSFVTISGPTHGLDMGACWREDDTSPLVRQFLRIARECRNM